VGPMCSSVMLRRRFACASIQDVCSSERRDACRCTLDYLLEAGMVHVHGRTPSSLSVGRLEQGQTLQCLLEI
jgi:hypothetical protein